VIKKKGKGPAASEAHVLVYEPTCILRYSIDFILNVAMIFSSSNDNLKFVVMYTVKYY